MVWRKLCSESCRRPCAGHMSAQPPGISANHLPLPQACALDAAYQVGHHFAAIIAAFNQKEIMRPDKAAFMTQSSSIFPHDKFLQFCHRSRSIKAAKPCTSARECAGPCAGRCRFDDLHVLTASELSHQNSL